MPPLLRTLEESGIAARDIIILIATGMHRPNLSQADVDRFQGLKVVDCQATVNELLKTHKKVAVIPDGPYVAGKIGRK